MEAPLPGQDRGQGLPRLSGQDGCELLWESQESLAELSSPRFATSIWTRNVHPRAEDT